MVESSLLKQSVLELTLAQFNPLPLSDLGIERITITSWAR